MLTDRQIQMMTKTGFSRLFWEKLSELRKKNPTITHLEVYEILETEYKAGTGIRRYKNFNSFRARRDAKKIIDAKLINYKPTAYVPEV